MCGTNTSIAKIMSEKISKILNDKTRIIEITTHHKIGSVETDTSFKKNNIGYVECPVMGGTVQEEECVLGGIVGASEDNCK